MSVKFCDCGNAIRQEGAERCVYCEIEHANRLGDWKNPIFDGPPTPETLENINTEADE